MALAKKLQELGWRQCDGDPCVWFIGDEQKDSEKLDVYGMALAHVDDFLEIKAVFRWTEWE
eukprot:14526183-Alexandrium_andersonii.AAC.1